MMIISGGTLYKVDHIEKYGGVTHIYYDGNKIKIIASEDAHKVLIDKNKELSLYE